MRRPIQTFFITPLFLVLLLVSAASGQTQDGRIQLSGLDHLAAKASETVSINIDQRMIKVASDILDDKDADMKEIKELVSGLKGIYVKSFEFDGTGDYLPADVELVRSQLKEPLWVRMVDVTSKKEGIVEVYIQLIGEQVGGLAVLVAEDKELTVVNIVGQVDLKKLAKLQGRYGIPDLEIEPKKNPKNE